MITSSDEYIKRKIHQEVNTSSHVPVSYCATIKESGSEQNTFGLETVSMFCQLTFKE